MSPALELRGAVAVRGGRRVLDGVDLQVRPGEVVGVLGVNGAGKTTVLRAVLGLQPLAEGQALIDRRPASAIPEPERARLVAYLPQERRIAWNLPARTLASLGAPHEPPARALHVGQSMLERVGLGALGDRGVLELSGGERARALLARLLVARAPALVADEPVAGLDPDAQMMVLEILRAESRAGAAVLVTLHDLTLAARFCDRIVGLAGGRAVLAGAPAEALSPEGLRILFGLDGSLVSTPHGPVIAAGRSPP